MIQIRVAKRRYEATKLYPPWANEGLQRDEYPYASTFEWGTGADVAYVPTKENQIQACSLYKNKKHMNYKFDVHTMYSTIFLSSDNIKESLKPDNLAISLDQNKHRLVAVPNTLIITTGSYGHIRGELKFLEKKNDNVDYDKYEHIVEAGLEVQTGKLQIINCPFSNSEFEIDIKPGVYGVRVYSSGLSNSNFDEQEGNDRYLIEIWPDHKINTKVLKQYNGY